MIDEQQSKSGSTIIRLVKFFMPNRKGTVLSPRSAEKEWRSIAARIEDVMPRRIYRLRIERRGRTAEFVVGEQYPFSVAKDEDPIGAELLTVAIFAATDRYVVCCRSPENPWGSHIINIDFDEVIDSEDFEA